MGLGTTLYVAGLGDPVRLDRCNCRLGVCVLAKANGCLSGRLRTLGACPSSGLLHNGRTAGLEMGRPQVTDVATRLTIGSSDRGSRLR
jgi:hypothetical protein